MWRRSRLQGPNVRFFMDHDVDLAVASRLRALGHEAWTANEAGLNRVADDELTVYADDKRAVLITHDREFSQRRRRNVVGRHLQLRCDEWEAADLIEAHLAQLLPILGAFDDIFVAVSPAGFEVSHKWD